jgi:hypothetical protein
MQLAGHGFVNTRARDQGRLDPSCGAGMICQTKVTTKSAQQAQRGGAVSEVVRMEPVVATHTFKEIVDLGDDRVSVEKSGRWHAIFKENEIQQRTTFCEPKHPLPFLWHESVQRDGPMGIARFELASGVTTYTQDVPVQVAYLEAENLPPP